MNNRRRQQLLKALLGLGLKTVLTLQGEEKGLKMVVAPASKGAGRDFAARIPLLALTLRRKQPPPTVRQGRPAWARPDVGRAPGGA